MVMNIYGYKCKQCGYIHYPYRMICKKCHKGMYTDFEPVALPKHGKLLTFTHLYTLPADFEVAKMTLGIVELENGNRITGQINIEDPKIGMEVRGEVAVVRQDEYTKNYGMVFYALNA